MTQINPRVPFVAASQFHSNGRGRHIVAFNCCDSKLLLHRGSDGRRYGVSEGATDAPMR